MSAREIHSRSAPAAVPAVLQTIFAAELVRPSSRIWLVSPWISDIPVIDNRTGGFSTIEPSWPRSRISLLKVLERQVGMDTKITVATTPEAHNEAFARAFSTLFDERSGCRFFRQEKLHEKGLLCDSIFLCGSMNLTFSGISSNEELVEVITDPDRVAKAHIELEHRWGVDQ